MSALENLPHDIHQRASAVFHLTVSYAFTMLKWTACENLPADLDSCETASAATAAAAAGARYVTMLFNDETHTYEQVDTCCISLLSHTEYHTRLCASYRLLQISTSTMSFGSFKHISTYRPVISNVPIVVRFIEHLTLNMIVEL